jgi:hypothetical protein
LKGRGLQAAWAAAPGLGSVPPGANRLPSRHRAEAATPLAGPCRGRRPSHPCTKGDPGGSADVGALSSGVHRPPSAERQSASGNHSVADLVKLVALPGYRQQHLAAFAPTCPSSNVQPCMNTVVEHRPPAKAALLRPGVRQHRPDHVLPVTGRRHVRHFMRCFVSSPGTANQALAEAGSPNAIGSRGFETKPLIKRSKLAAGIDSA